MSAPMKRHALDNAEAIPTKHSYMDVQDDKLKSFIAWANYRHFNLNHKVRVGREGSCAQYGMIATEDIEKDETLFQIPREMLLHPGTTEIKDLLSKNQSSLESTSGWVPLLVSLMYEYNSPTSVWRPYFDLVPDFNDLDLPMFWISDERYDLLKGTGVSESVKKDLINIETEFREVVLPFVEQHIDKFSLICKDLEFYKKMVAFVMAYSFTEPIKTSDKSRDTDESDDDDDDEEVMSPPMMVPMADILNHVAKNNAKLTFEKDALKMVATKNIKKGEEVFNTYGELSNGHLLHMYGFAEPYPDNHYDEVIIDGETLLEAAKELECNSGETLHQKKAILESMGLLETTFVAGVEGILTEEEMCQALKIWTMPSEALSSFDENEGWIDDDDGDESLLYDGGIGNLSSDKKLLLSRCAENSMKRYKTTLEEDEKSLKKDNLTSRQRHALYVNIGQKQILKKILEASS